MYYERDLPRDLRTIRHLEIGPLVDGFVVLSELVRCSVIETGMRSNGIVVPTPGFDDDLRLATTAEPFDAQALVAELAVEALVGTVLPRLARVDQCGLDAGMSSHSRIALPTNSGPLSERR